MGLKHSRLPQEQQDRLVECFVLGVTARTAAEILHLNKNTTTYFYYRLRLIIEQRLFDDSPVDRDLQIPETHLRRRFGRAGAATATTERPIDDCRVPLFGLSLREDRVYVQMIHILRQQGPGNLFGISEMPDSVVYSTGLGPGRIVDVSDLKTVRLPHYRQQRLEAARTDRKIIAFWNRTKRQLRKYHGVPRRHLHLFLVECEFRFNNGKHAQLLSVLRHWIGHTSI